MIGLFKRIIRLSGRFRGRIYGAFVCAVLESVLSKMPFFMAFLVLSSFSDGTIRTSHCLGIGLTLVGVVILQTVVHYLSDRLQSATGYMMFAEKRMELGDHLRKLPMGYFTAGNMGKVSSVLSTDMVFVEEVAMNTLAKMMSYQLSSIILLVFMFILDIRLGLVALAVTIVAAVMAGRMNRMSMRESAVRQAQSEKLTDAVLSFIEGIGIIKSYNLLGEQSAQLSDSFKKSKDTSIGFEEKILPWTRGLDILYGVGIAAIIGFVVYLQGSGILTLSYLLGVLLFVFDLFGPLKSLYGEASRLTVMNSCIDRIEEVLTEKELPDKGTQHIPPNSHNEYTVRFENVTFAYEDTNVLHNVSFEVPPKSMLALVGPSGGGKSTIANLLARFWDVQGGAIKINGQDIREVPLEELMRHISMVFQRVYLFQDTVYNNIAIGRLQASREDVYEAAKKARCYDFIMRLPDGFDTVIGEGGATLSGGEKQRISIARCILKDAPIIILDEATASVDADNERYIQEAITELVRGKTLLVIAHRLNTIQSADQILVISDGKIVQLGKHDNLVEQNGIYRDFVCARNHV